MRKTPISYHYHTCMRGAVVVDSDGQSFVLMLAMHHRSIDHEFLHAFSRSTCLYYGLLLLLLLLLLRLRRRRPTSCCSSSSSSSHGKAMLSGILNVSHAIKTVTAAQP